MPRPAHLTDTAASGRRARSKWGSARSITGASALLVLAGLFAGACGSSSPPAAGGTTATTQPGSRTTGSGNGSTTTPTTAPVETATTLPAPSTNGLAVEAKIALGLPWTATDTVTPGPPAAEAPNGAVFVAAGSVVYVVEGNSAPIVAEHAAGPVLALAADATDLYVETGLTVTDYNRASGNEVTSWTIPGSGTPSSAGLFAEPGVIWAWNAFPTVPSSFNPAKVYRIVGSSVYAVKVSAYPGDMDADANGLYFVGLRVPDGSGQLQWAAPSGTVTGSAAGVAFGSPIALYNGTVVVENQVANHSYAWETFDSSTLKLLATTQTGLVYADPIADTGSGLLLMEVPSSLPPTAAVIQYSPTGSQESGQVGFPSNSEWLLQGYYPAVISDQSGQLYLMRLT